jgi:hypothetical protein
MGLPLSERGLRSHQQTFSTALNVSHSLCAFPRVFKYPIRLFSQVHLSAGLGNPLAPRDWQFYMHFPSLSGRRFRLTLFLREWEQIENPFPKSPLKKKPTFGPSPPLHPGLAKRPVLLEGNTDFAYCQKRKSCQLPDVGSGICHQPYENQTKGTVNPRWRPT